MNKGTIDLAKEIYISTISAHYRHGLQEGQTLLLDQIAGESLEAALRFENTLRGELEAGKVTRVMQLNDAFRAGYNACMVGETDAAPNDMSEELRASWFSGYRRAEETSRRQG